MGTPTKATSAQGVQLQRDDGFGNFNLIGEVKDFNGPTEVAKTIDVTNFDSKAKEYINGLIDGGEVTFMVNFVGTDLQQQGLRADLTNRVRRNFRVLMADPGPNGNPTTINFVALVTGCPIKGSVDNVVDMNVTLKITGLPTFTWPS